MDEDNLRYAEFVDLPATIPVIKRRKLVIVSKFLANNRFLNAAITAAEIQQSRKAPAGVAAPIYHASVPDPHRGAPEVYTDILSEFSGEAVDYEDWERKAGVTIEQTAYKDLLDNPAVVGDIVAGTRSKKATSFTA